MGVAGALRGICISPITAWLGDPCVYERHLAVGVSKSTTEGSPAAPCLRIAHIQFWRFRWAVEVGARTVTVQVKQAINAAPYPKIVIKANPDVGLAADVTQSAGPGSDWKSISAGFNASAIGAVWVELHNALPTGNYDCFFDHIVTA